MKNIYKLSLQRVNFTALKKREHVQHRENNVGTNLLLLAIIRDNYLRLWFTKVLESLTEYMKDQFNWLFIDCYLNCLFMIAYKCFAC